MPLLKCAAPKPEADVSQQRRRQANCTSGCSWASPSDVCGRDAGPAAKRRLLSAWAVLVRVLGRVGRGEVRPGMGGVSSQPEHETKFQGCVMPRFKVEQLRRSLRWRRDVTLLGRGASFLERGDWERRSGVRRRIHRLLEGWKYWEYTGGGGGVIGWVCQTVMGEATVR